MAARTATALKPAQKIQRELEDLQLVLKARNGSQQALDDLMRRYTGFVRLKASSYFLAGGESDDLVQEGLIGLYKAVRDFRPDKETSFRSFAELCVTRQIITAIKTATRYKHSPLNTYVSFSHTPAGQESDGDCTLGDALPGPSVNDPSVCVISTEELQSLVFCARHGPVVARVAGAHACTSRGTPTSRWPKTSACDTKTIDNALQRVKRKILAHQKDRRGSRPRYSRGTSTLTERHRPSTEGPGAPSVCTARRAADICTSQISAACREGEPWFPRPRSRRRDSNPRPCRITNAAALPAELLRRPLVGYVAAGALAVARTPAQDR